MKTENVDDSYKHEVPMKTTVRFILSLSILFTLTQCESFFDFNPSELNSVDVVDDVEGNDGNNEGGDDGNGGGNGGGGGIDVEVSVDDPEVSSCECQRIDVPTDELLIEPTEIPDDLPESFDLSELMPPVRSQGYQGSCVAFAVSYYLKSYQEKIQYDFEYLSFADVMSPSYVYNQVKAASSCLSGSELRKSLRLLQDEGVVSWDDFPYISTECSIFPSAELVEKALENRIGDFYALGIPEDNTDENYTLINLYKKLISEGNPIVTSMLFSKLIFEHQGEEYVATGFLNDTGDPNPSANCHAILIVGYDDTVGAFKFINSWGSYWGNEGFGWLSYDFFRPLGDDLFIDGYSESYVVYDLE